jgi:Na+/proline symporter
LAGGGRRKAPRTRPTRGCVASARAETEHCTRDRHRDSHVGIVAEARARGKGEVRSRPVLDPELTGPLAVALAVYLAVMLGIGVWARGRIGSNEDFLVAGRRLPLLLAWPTLLATWFGAGTLLTAVDEVRADGLRKAALDPIGAGLCLLVAGAWLAGPLWRRKLLTLSDFFRVRFGARAEVASALLMIPTYFGWIAAQFVAFAGLLQVCFGIDPVWGIALVAIVGTAYTLLGGMWSVTATDAVQMAIVAVGLVLLTSDVLVALGGSWAGGLHALREALPAERAAIIPTESLRATVGWLGVLAVGALGNLPGQDLLQRVFASRSERTAVWACHLAGLTYLVLGILPVVLGLAASVLHPEVGEDTSTLTLLAMTMMSRTSAIVLMLAVASAVLSTIDSAILSPASVLSENLLRRLPRFAAMPPLSVSRGAVLAVALVSLGLAYVGSDAYELLEGAYELGLVSLLVPLLVGVRSEWGDERAALWAMGVGTSAWLLHAVVGIEGFAGVGLLPVPLTAAALAAVVYTVQARRG